MSELYAASLVDIRDRLASGQVRAEEVTRACLDRIEATEPAIHALLAEVPHLNELNIGHSIICESVYCGLEEAVRKMLGEMASYQLG